MVTNNSEAYFENMHENIRSEIERNGRLKSKISALVKRPCGTITIIEHKHPDTSHMNDEDSENVINGSIKRFFDFIIADAMELISVFYAEYITEDDGTNYVFTYKKIPNRIGNNGIKKKFKVDFGQSVINEDGTFVKGKVELIEEEFIDE